jgi:hypothetical protein
MKRMALEAWRLDDGRSVRENRLGRNSARLAPNAPKARIRHAWRQTFEFGHTAVVG